MAIVIFIFYLVAFSLLISKISFFKNAGIGNKLLITLFIIKVFAGIAYAWFYSLPRYVSTSDTWRFYRLSLQETNWLKNNPLAFVKDLFFHSYSRSGGLFSGENSYWNDLKSNVIIKLMAILNVFTNNGYYTNIIFFNFLFLFGLVALFKVFNQLYPKKQIIALAGIFLLPSTLFWCSGIHKDGLILSALGIIIFAFHRFLRKKTNAKTVVAGLLCLLLLFSLRNYIVFALAPALFSWWLSSKLKYKSIAIFSLVYIIGIVLFFTIPIVMPSLNFPMFLVNKQHEFLLLEGGSQIPVTPLEPTLQNFISFLPTAVNTSFFRPHITEIKNLSYIPAAAEILLLLGLVAISIFHHRKNNHLGPSVLFFLFFSVSIMLLSGYTVPFTGAIVRYRSIVLPLLITPLVCASNIDVWIKQKTNNFALRRKSL